MSAVSPRCPGGDWTYDPNAPCVAVRRVGSKLPLIWVVGRGLVEPHPSDPIDSPPAALAAHILQAHPNSETARAVGEWETYEPLRELNEALGEWAVQSWWRRLLPYREARRG